MRARGCEGRRGGLLCLCLGRLLPDPSHAPRSSPDCLPPPAAAASPPLPLAAPRPTPAGILLPLRIPSPLCHPQGGDGPAPEEQTCRSLFSDRSFATPEEAFAHDAKHHGFDLRRFARRHRLTDYDCIKAVNFIRAEVAAGRDPLPALLGARSITAPSEMPFAGDQWLTPVLEDDGLMFHDFEVMLNRSRQPCPLPCSFCSSCQLDGAAPCEVRCCLSLAVLPPWPPPLPP